MRLPAFYEAAGGGETRINPEHVIRLKGRGLWMARARSADRLSRVCRVCLAAQENVAAPTTALALADGVRLLVLGTPTAVAQALLKGRDLLDETLLYGRRQAASIGAACLADDLTASHHAPRPLLPLKPQRVADEDLDYLAASVAAQAAAVERED